MKTIASSLRYCHMPRFSIFLVLVVLIIGTIGCEPVVRYNLTVSSTAGGKVVSPGEGTFSCSGRRGVNLIAVSSPGYHFVNWTGNVSTIADVNSTATTITLCGNSSIVANFDKSVDGGCFIATAAYGTAMALEIEILREFRDEYLLTNSLGQGLVDVYCTVSPPIAQFITEHPNLKPIVRAGLEPIVTMCSIVLDIIPQFAGNEA